MSTVRIGSCCAVVSTSSSKETSSHSMTPYYNESADGVKSIGARYREEWRHVV
ncbi:hypothetical protein DPMN_162904 [Dreissena polymorpha]|uniref:Uncharacterized protein n=1 Tax=Dreissena polymorpha TaxID=45954 RepID=A0A9D4IUR0_DREPO|nr:hypothetical protein DPMN_162904 [Dreissena polymorpha]